jgi:putative ABC transport system permease protein
MNFDPKYSNFCLMLRNYLLLAIRNLKKNRMHALINIGGMIVAFACSLFILLLVYRHFTYNDFQKNRNSIYKVYSYAIGPNGEELGTSQAFPLTPAIKSEATGVVRATAITTRGRLVRANDRTLDMNTTMVDEDFLHIFTFPVVLGNSANPLSSTSNAVISETSAKKLFGNEDPIGKKLEVKLGGEWIALTVTAIVRDFPQNSSIKFDLLGRTEINPDYANARNNWDNQSHPVYVQVAPGVSRQQVESRLRLLLNKYRPLDPAIAKKDGYLADKNGDYRSLRLLPLTEEHFSPQLGQNGTVSRAFLYVLILISAVILLIASFNFVNLNVGLSFTRTKEIGIRKCLGAGRRQIWFQVWGESFLMVVFAMLFSMGLLILMIRKFNESLGNIIDIHNLASPLILSVIFALVIFVSFITSGYPSSVLASLRTVDILKGKVTIKRPGMLRNALIVTQFVIAIALMCCTFVIYRQFDYLRSAPLGYSTTDIISIPLKNDDIGRDIIAQLRTRLAVQSSVIAVSGADVNLGLGEDHSSSTSVACFTHVDKTICGEMMNVDYDFLKTLGIKPVSGRDFSTAYTGDTGSAIIATEKYAAQFGREATAGYSYYYDSSSPKVKIVGVIPDFKLKSFNDQQRPLMISLAKGKSMPYAWIKVRTNNPAATMHMVEQVYAEIEPGVEFKGSYVNENIDRLYQEEKTMASLFTAAASIAIILSCMGLFGIASIVIRQRVKEIGVRKVLGASVSGIVNLVGREFLKPVFIALLISIPIAWWTMHAWLQNYSIRVNMDWWIFAFAGLIAIVITAVTISFQTIRAARSNPVTSLRTD